MTLNDPLGNRRFGAAELRKLAIFSFEEWIGFGFE